MLGLAFSVLEYKQKEPLKRGSSASMQIFLAAADAKQWSNNRDWAGAPISAKYTNFNLFAGDGRLFVFFFHLPFSPTNICL